jgi:thiol:disulfide interchange protein DsbA
MKGGKKKKTMNRLSPAVVLGLGGLLFLLLSPLTTRAYDMAVTFPSFGTGGVQVRLYTDYFCAPCSRMEPKVEGLLSDLVRRNAITLTFVDTPVHTHTAMYAKYFLYILKKDRSFPHVMRARELLFEAARNKIEERDGLEEFLRKNNIGYKEFDPKPTFATLSAMIREDGVKSTPTCVIIKDGKKGVFTGDTEIPKALELLR